MQPKVYIAYSHESPGFVTAMFYLEHQIDLYGWYMVAKEHDLSTAFFMLESFYANRAPALYRSTEDDVYEPWVTAYPPTKSAVRCPIPDPISHELERLQSEFVQEWLFFESDPNIGAEVAAYHKRGLPIQTANIKCRKLSRLDREDKYWIHTTPGTDANIASFLEKYWWVDGKMPSR